MRQKVVIIGHGYTSRLGVIRALGREGCEVAVIVMTGYKRDGKTLNTKKPIDCYSKYVSQVHYCYSKDEEGLIQLLLGTCSDPQQKVVIIPDSDFSAVVVDDNKERLSPFFLFPHIIHEPKSVRYWMNKENQKVIATQVGLNHAKSQHIEVKDGKYDIPKNIYYPCFTKSLITISGGKQYFRKCENNEQLRELLDFVVLKEDTTILVEDYIDIQTEYAVLGFSDGKEVVIPGVVQFVESSKSHFGIAMKGKIMPTIGFDDIIEKFKKFVLKMGFVGVFDIDFFFGDGKWWFGEMNLRFGGSGYAVTKMGVNLPAMLVMSLMGESTDKMNKQITRKATYVNDRMLMDDWYENYISSWQFRNFMDSADIRFIPDKEDNEPQHMFMRRFYDPVTNLKRLVKKFIRRKK